MMISIVMPLYNKQESISFTVESVLNQSYDFFELIIIDDGSTDKSLNVIKNFDDKRIRIIEQSNAGVSAARNRGIKEAQYDLIAFLDADDLWEPNYLEEMIGFIKEFPDAGMYGCSYDEIEGDIIKNRNFGLPPGFRGIIRDYFKLAGKNHLFWTSAIIISKSKVSQIGFFDERMNIMGEDLDLWFRVAYFYEVAFFNKVLAHYNVGAENRGMLRKHLFSNSILCYVDKYKEMERNNEDFRLFINLFKIRKVPELLSSYEISNGEIIHYLSHIDKKGQSLSHRIFLFMPLWLKRRFLFIWKTYRGLEI